MASGFMFLIHGWCRVSGLTDCVQGYGFIERDDNKEDIFVHQTELQMKGFRRWGTNADGRGLSLVCVCVSG